MKIIITRYYGDDRTAKSTMQVVDDECELQMECEARECEYVDYAESYRGCSKVCLPVGVFDCKIKATDISPMTIVVSNAPGHKGCRVGWHAVVQSKCNEVLVGMSDEYPKPKWRRLVDQMDTFKRLEKLVYGAYLGGESIKLEVKNEIEEGEGKA